MAAVTLAHELGHSFGLEHNPTNKSEPCYWSRNELGVMDTYVDHSPPKKISKCQQAALENFIEHGR